MHQSTTLDELPTRKTTRATPTVDTTRVTTPKGHAAVNGEKIYCHCRLNVHEDADDILMTTLTHVQVHYQASI